MRYVLLAAGQKNVELPNGINYSAVAAVNIASSTNASPIQVNTSTDHGLATGDLVYIASHATNTNANGVHQVTVVDHDSFTLDGTTGNGVGSSTGTVRTDVVTLTDTEFEAIAASALGDEVLDLGVAPEIGGDEVTVQGTTVSISGTAPVALTAAAVVTANAATQTGSYVQADVQSIADLANSLKTQVNALVADVTALRTRQATIITNLSNLGSALTGPGKALD